MNTPKIPHVSLTTKDGYVFRKRYQTGTIYLSLRTKELVQAVSRGAALSIRFLEVAQLDVFYNDMYINLKKFRDETIMREQIDLLKRVQNSVNTSTFTFSTGEPVSASVITPTQPVSVDEKIAAVHV